MSTTMQRWREARRAARLAEQACHHWDHEGGLLAAADGHMECCYALDEAWSTERRTRRAFLKSEQP